MESVEDCLKLVNDQKVLIEKLYGEYKDYGTSLLGSRCPMEFLKWDRAIKQEENKLIRLRAQLSEARGE